MIFLNKNNEIESPLKALNVASIKKIRALSFLQNFVSFLEMTLVFNFFSYFFELWHVCQNFQKNKTAENLDKHAVTKKNMKKY